MPGSQTTLVRRLASVVLLAIFVLPAAADCRALSAFSPGGMACCDSPASEDATMGAGCCRMDSAPSAPAAPFVAAAKIRADQPVAGPAPPTALPAVMMPAVTPAVRTFENLSQDRLYLRLSAIRR